MSQLGFYYTGQNDIIKCSDCGKQIEANNVISPLSERKYHSTRKCVFVDAVPESDDDDSSSSEEFSSLPYETEQLETDSAEVYNLPENQNKNSVTFSTDENPAHFTKLTNEYADAQEYLQLPNKENCQDENNDSGYATSRTTDVSESLMPSPFKVKVPHQKQHDFQQLNGTQSSAGNLDGHESSSKMDHACQENKTLIKEWYDLNHFYSEAACQENLNERDCPKKNNHAGLVKLPQFKTENLPFDMRREDLTRFIKTMSKLIFKIHIKKTSNNRPKNDCKDTNRHFGSGTAYLDCVDYSEKWIQTLRKDGELTPSQGEYIEKSQRNAASSGDNVFYFSVMTSSHVVFDQDEAFSAELECEHYSKEEQSEGNNFPIKGVAVKHNDGDGNYKAYIICMTTFKDFMKWLFTARQNVIEEIGKLHNETKEILTNHCFLVFHPHGGEKRLSFGKCAPVNYGMIDKVGTDGSPTQTMEYCGNEESLERHKDNLREVLLYQALSCPGSSGCPVVTFRKTFEDGKSKYSLCLWVHMGHELETKLGSSIMKEIDTDEEQQIPPKPMTNIVENLSKKDLRMNTVPPVYPEFYSWEARLKSYNSSYKSTCKHITAELALAGFYYTGYEDCIRCFYCGLGLKCWKKKDDVYEEHGRARPECGFLKICMEYEGNMDSLLKLVQKDQHENEKKTNTTVRLLQEEKKRLQWRPLCKLCCRYDVKELFLPCGELFACEFCNDIISTCPSCDKKIQATITVYMS